MNFPNYKIENFEIMKTERDPDKCVLADLLNFQDSKSLPMTSCSMLLIFRPGMARPLSLLSVGVSSQKTIETSWTPIPPSRPGIMLVDSPGTLLTPSA